MWTAPVSVRNIHGNDRVDRAVRGIEEAWQTGRPDLVQYCRNLGPDRSVSELSLIIKADLRCRFRLGEQPRVTEYLELFPEFRAQSERMLSLIYEEFCLLEERGARPDVQEFCERYSDWKDSLVSQLRHHSLLSQIVAPQVSPVFPRSGEQFEEFLLQEELGRGGSARVYRANDKRLGGRDVALKIYFDRGSEASILGRLDHPHIVPVHSTPFQAESRLRGLCMPYRPGVPLDEVIRRLSLATKPGPCGALAIWNALTDETNGVHKSSTVVKNPSSAWPEGPGWQSFPIRGSFAEGVAWIALKARRSPPTCPLARYSTPRRQTGERSVGVQRRPAASRFQSRI